MSITENINSGGVRGVLHRAAGDPVASLVLAHGASSDCRSKLIVAVAEAFAQAGVNALRIDLPFRQRRPTGPPNPSTGQLDRDGLREAADLLRGDHPVFIGGHSYGGRQATMLASEQADAADALLLFSYPLHPPGKLQQLRTAHLPQIRVPSFFVHGSRDPFGSPEEMTSALELIPARHELHLIQSAGHDLRPVLSKPQAVVEAFLTFYRTQ